MSINKSNLINTLSKNYPNFLKKDLTRLIDIFLSEIKNSLSNKLINQKRLKLFKSIMRFMEVRVDLDLQGWEEMDIFAHK